MQDEDPLDLRDVFDHTQTVEGLVVPLSDLDDQPTDELVVTISEPASLQKLLRSIELLPKETSWTDPEMVAKRENSRI